ncbi:STAS domain-containing protein [Gilvimarinus sp. DA14]|uniref:STAS domain-containing protein n=1 Tax=Gilvimarinus sp. DA14 TaxID=2956798 RepID=UPI0020B72FC5|nr:STAS domain-containing protein [Gilvimarinus sp. DA14]UTF59809.1 STAS domain-containing protein [Gilvimarinus sp. DA14]
MKKAAPFLGDEYLKRQADNRVFCDSTTFADESEANHGPHIDWHPINNGHSIKVHVAGDINIECMAQWRRLIKETSGNGIHQFEFDLKEVKSLSLAGLAMLLMFKDDKQAQARDISLTQCNNQLYKRLLWSGLTREFIVRPCREL